MLTGTGTKTAMPGSASCQQEQEQQQQQQQQQEGSHHGVSQRGDDHHHSLSQAFSTYMKHDEQEQAHWGDVCRAYQQYATFAMCSWTNQRHRIQQLPDHQKRLLPPSLLSQFDDSNAQNNAGRTKLYRDAAVRNQFCLDCILRHAGMAHSQEVGRQSKGGGGGGGTTTSSPAVSKIVRDEQISKVSSVLKSLVRDWSQEGKAERDMAYGPILRQVKRYLPIQKTQGDKKRPRQTPPKLSVPGAGVGRLALELAALGYRVQGNEFSLFMLLASDFILNSGITPEKPLAISPWLLETRNVHDPLDPMRKILIPDVNPQAFLLSSEERMTLNDGAAPDQQDFSMAAGDFVGIYSHPRERGQWDGVVSCFFLDAAPNVVEFVQVIHAMLKEGGILVNFGPLLYHWSGPAMRPDDGGYDEYVARFSHLDQRYMHSVDISWADLREVLVNIGFEILEETQGIDALYTADPKSMLNMAYRCVSFVARKTGRAPS